MNFLKLTNIFLLFLLAGCATQTVTPLEKDLVQIDVSATPSHGRAGAQQLAVTKAAKTTIAYGYDKFLVLNNNTWNEQTYHSASASSVQGNYSQYGSNGAGNISGGSFGSANTVRRPEAKLIVRMFKNGDKGSEKAIDAKIFLARQKTSE